MRWWARTGRRPAAVLVVLLTVVVLAAGCQVHTQVDVDANKDGSGTVAVVVTLDPAATAAVGNVKSQLQTADLVAAGWTVTGPSTGPDGSTVLEATQPFESLSQASTLVAEIAGRGPSSSRPFRLTLTSHKTWWSTQTRLRGRVDLSCDLSCFGDPGLAKALGTSTGANPGPVAAQRRDFSFAVSVSLPGKVQHTNAASRSTQSLTWKPRLGSQTVLSATTSYPDSDHVMEAVVLGSLAAALLVAGLVVLLVFRWRRRRRRRGEGDHGGRRHARRRHTPAVGSG